MKKFLSALSLACALSASAQTADSIIPKLFTESLTHPQAYENLRFLCKKIGGRSAGSPQAAAAVEWARQTMLSMGFDSVYLQETTVPHWVRGPQEEAYIQSSMLPGGNLSVPVCALGGSVATAPEGLTAEIVEVKSIDELKQLGKKVKGKIVFFNRPMDPALYYTFRAYGGAADQRFHGPSEAAQLGALACIVRSMTVNHDDIPHTGATRKSDIPSAAISTNAADKLGELLARDPHLKFYLKMSCYRLPDTKSYNVIGEIRGSEKPNEIITVGGHLDSWDQAEGANDDGTGCVQSMEVLRLFKTLGIRPKHTLRAVMFMNEEFGLNGGLTYAAAMKKSSQKQYIAMESDAGGFTPLGFSIDTSQQFIDKIASLATSLKAYGIYDLHKGGSGSDVEPLKEQGVLTMELLPDSQRYFDYHHTKVDVFENVNQRELQLGAAAMAGMIYVLDSM
jgi:hypothetical protein